MKYRKISEDETIFAKGSIIKNGIPIEGKRVFFATEDDAVALAFAVSDKDGNFETPLYVGGVIDIFKTADSEDVEYICTY